MSNRLDTVVRLVSIGDVLQFAGVEAPQREREPIRCPLPGHNERSPSFMVQQSSKGYRCHGCGAHGGVLALVVALGLAPSISAAVDLLAERFGIPKDERDRVAWIATKELERRRAAHTLPPREPDPEPTLEDRETLRERLRGLIPLDGTPGAAYLQLRGLCAVTAAANGTKFHPKWLGSGAAVVFAVRDREGRLVAAQGRYINPAPSSPKTKTKGRLLGVYAAGPVLDPRTAVVAITEAPIDALSLAVSELPAIALCGATVRPAWLRKALAFRAVVLATDNDAAGDAAAESLRSWLNLGTRCSRLVLPEGVKDVNELLRRNPSALLELARAARFAAQPSHLVAEEA